MFSWDGREAGKQRASRLPGATGRMWLKRLALTNFRSYSRLGLELPPGVVVFHGANGQGKTNLLEAVYVLATTKSPRAGGDRELLNWQALF